MLHLVRAPLTWEARPQAAVQGWEMAVTGRTNGWTRPSRVARWRTAIAPSVGSEAPEPDSMAVDAAVATAEWFERGELRRRRRRSRRSERGMRVRTRAREEHERGCGRGRRPRPLWRLGRRHGWGIGARAESAVVAMAAARAAAASEGGGGSERARECGGGGSERGPPLRQEGLTLEGRGSGRRIGPVCVRRC